MLIACATDRSYLEMTGVLIRSIFSQAHREEPELVVVCYQLTRRDKEKLSACADGGADLTFIDLQGGTLRQLRSLETKRYLSPTVYATLTIPSLLPGRMGRLLYLDSDIVVNAPLEPLYEAELEDHPLGAVQDLARVERLRNLNEAIGHPRDSPYFNSGVMLMDLDRWRARRLCEAAMDYARNRTGAILQHDQAVLNKVLGQDWAKLDARWNDNPARRTPEQIATMPIQHFWGIKKPFYADYPLPLRRTYDHYRSMTPWSNARRRTALGRSVRVKLRKWQTSARERIEAMSERLGDRR